MCYGPCRRVGLVDGRVLPSQAWWQSHRRDRVVALVVGRVGGRVLPTGGSCCLKPGGIVVKQSGCNQIQLDSNLKTMRAYKQIFANFGMYYQNVPTYPGGDMGFAWATNGPALDSVDVGAVKVRTKHYHKPIHNACFAMPLHIHNAVEEIRQNA